MAAAGSSNKINLAVIGAGPIGLELAHSALRRGLKVEVFEKATSVAGHVQDYGHVRLFSPWSLNMSSEGKRMFAEQELPFPDPNAFPTGQEYLDNYLSPLAVAIQSHSECRGFHLDTEVLSIGRGSLLKGESIGGGDVQMPSNPLCVKSRRDTPFRLLVREAGDERYCEGFDVVVDCTGFYRSDLANWVGKGGLPALGEKKLRSEGKIWTRIPDVLGKDRARFAGKRSLIVGAGMSAATTVRDLTELSKTEAGTEALFLTRNAAEPFKVIEDDVLPQRKALCELGNSVSRGEVTCIKYLGGGVVYQIKQETPESRFRVCLRQGTDESENWEEVDEIVCCVGYHPDGSIYDELQVHQCYASNGPMKLAATLIGGSGDCLAQVSAGADTLKNPEPGFFILGSKSYGRKSSFLLKIGHEQVNTILDTLAPTASM
eukprot:TRINITY_DN13361_c4_g1_i1.p1 TRINITY_DN13361_c4_g1~~TRINITY_DN13361_c4_g1_i1.p1  ORF type:complete len:431 (-),score=69.86 TRINITY_DN13361_c4_g1_i1:329-1621(-)